MNVGSLENIPEVPGIAHLLEHVLFMGNSKFTEENGFDSFLSELSGTDNATTYHSRTVFEFEVPKQHFREALERFAHSFISPLFREESIMKEINPVDSEYLEGLSNDDSRLEQFFTIFAKPGHGLGNFSWGNRKSLIEMTQARGINLREELVKFWEKYYVADKMVLVVQSQEPFENLEEWVQVFSLIPSVRKGNRAPPPKRIPASPYVTSEFRQLYFVKPILDYHRLLFSWSLPSQLLHYKVKPITHIGNLVGHEGAGGLVSCLRRKGLIQSLCAGNDESDSDHNIHHAVFSIDVTLTEKGLRHIDEVVEDVSAYLAMLREHGPLERFFEEEALIELIKVRWEDEVGALNAVTTLCKHLFLYTNDHVLVGPHVIFEYDEKVVRDVLDKLTMDRANFIISSHKALRDEEYDLKEPWFGIPYHKRQPPDSWLAPPPQSRREQFKLPVPNEFIARDFELIKEDLRTDYPVVVSQSDLHRLWYKKDNNFRMPKAHVNFVLLQSYHRSSPIVYAALDLFIEILGMNISEDVYAADLAGLVYSAYLSDIGLVVCTEGFNETLPRMIEVLVKHIRHFTFDKQTFDNMKEKLAQSYYNSFTDSEKLAKLIRYQICEPVYWSSIEKRNALISVTPQMLRDCHREFFSQAFMECLIQGNVSRHQATQITEKVVEQFGFDVLTTKPEPRVHELPPNVDNYCRVKCFCADEKNSHVTNYYQIGPCDIKEFCRLDLLSTYMSEPAFDELRTKQGLGYSVIAQHHDTFGIGGYSITITSPADKFTCSEVDDRIEKFLENLALKISGMSVDQFESIVDARITTKAGPDLHLKEEADRNWAEIVSFNYCFDRLKKEVKYLETITLAEFQRWTIDKLKSNSRRKLSVQVVGNGVEADHELTTLFSEYNTLKHVMNGSAAETYELKFYTPKVQVSGDKKFVQDIRLFKNVLRIYPMVVVDQ